jgi:hypothetical protein
MNERITLRPNDKIPYGYYAAYHFLPRLFPNAKIGIDKAAPLEWKGIDEESSNQAIIMTGSYFLADEAELRQLINFARRGNHIFIITTALSYEANQFFGLSGSYFGDDEGFKNEYNDSIGAQLTSPPFPSAQKYLYPGKRISYSASAKDDKKRIVLGRNNAGRANFFYFKAGEGSISIHLSPMAFTNYFILHKNNIEYYQQALSVIPRNVDRIVWNECYLFKRGKSEEPNFLKVLFRYPAFKWALLTAGATILLFAFMYIRRRQRIIPVFKKPANESLDFIKTIGRLYHDKRDHTNLAQKMGVYFLDHVRQRYLLATHTLDDDFVTALHAKTGYDLESLNGIVIFIKYLRNNPIITEHQLIHFHKQLENFYQNS